MTTSTSRAHSKTDPGCEARFHGTYSAYRKADCTCPEAYADHIRWNEDPERRAQRQRYKRELRERKVEARLVELEGRLASGWFPAPADPSDVAVREWPWFHDADNTSRIVFLHDTRACEGMDVNVFFPDDEDGVGSEQARRVCYSCPVVDSCLTAAIRRDEEYGIWGGHSKSERDMMMGRVTPSWAIAG